MIEAFIDFISRHRIESLGVVTVLLLVGAKPLLWWLFSFDERIAAVLHQKKSSEVRVGKITESLAPLLDEFPVDVKKTGTTTVFLGQPIDFVHFDPDDGITFIEVKSGGAKLSEGQRRLKEQVENGRVRWQTFRVDGEHEIPSDIPLRLRRRR